MWRGLSGPVQRQSLPIVPTPRSPPAPARPRVRPWWPGFLRHGGQERSGSGRERRNKPNLRPAKLEKGGGPRAYPELAEGIWPPNRRFLSRAVQFVGWGLPHQDLWPRKNRWGKPHPTIRRKKSGGDAQPSIRSRAGSTKSRLKAVLRTRRTPKSNRAKQTQFTPAPVMARFLAARRSGTIRLGARAAKQTQFATSEA